MNKVELYIGGLNCANCANKIDTKLKTFEGIENGGLNFYKKKVSFEVMDGVDKDVKTQEIIDMINRTESGLDISIIENEEKEGYDIIGEEVNIEEVFSEGHCEDGCGCHDHHCHGEGKKGIGHCHDGDKGHHRIEKKPHHHCEGVDCGCSDIVEKIERDIESGNVSSDSISKSIDFLKDGGVRKLIAAFIFYFGAIAIKHITGNFSIYIAMMAIAYVISAKDVFFKAMSNVKNGIVFDENFLMLVATIGAVAIKEYPEAVGVMLFYGVGELLESKAVDKSRRNIESLMNIKPEVANLVRGNRMVAVKPESLKVGDHIIVRVGERVPIDGIVVKGRSRFDTSSITGESVLRSVGEGEEINSGVINRSSAVEVEVVKEYSDSTVARILDMVENAVSKKSRTENFITVFARYYTPTVVFAAVFLTVVPVIFFGQSFDVWFYRSLVFLVVSCPCALVLSIPLGYFSGIGVASKSGVLVKGSNYLDAVKDVKTIVFDKTGTLTKGVFKVSSINPALGMDKDDIIKYAAIAESRSTHPIAQSILDYAQKLGYGNIYDNEKIVSYEEIAAGGIRVDYDGIEILAGNFRLMDRFDIAYKAVENSSTKVYVAVDGKFAGSIEISDEIKPGTAEAISSLKNLGVKNLVMLTGDSESVAEEFSKKLGITEYYADLLPDDKVHILEKVMKKSPDGSTAFVGDGINDAPAIARADIGISMGGVGSDAAIEASDMVIMTDEISRISSAIEISRRTSMIVHQNIVFAIGIKILIMILSAFGLADMWVAIFGDVGVSVLAVLNSLRIMKYKEKSATPLKKGHSIQ